MPKLIIEPGGAEYEISADKDLLSVLREKEIYIKSSCGGHASCSDCIIKIKEGTNVINSPSFEEGQLLGNVFHITKERLACQTKISGDVTIDISNHDKAAEEEKRRAKSGPKTKVRKPAEIEESKKKRFEERKLKDEQKKEKEGGMKRPKRQ